MALTTNLVAYWKLDESSGNAADSVGDNTGTNSNVTFSTGKINNGAVFNGSNAEFNCTRLAELESVGACTIAGWLKQTTLDQRNAFFCKGVNGGASNGPACYTYTNGNMYIEIGGGGNRGYLDYSPYMSAATWTFVAVVFDGSGTGNSGRLKVYFNATERSMNYDGTIPTTTTADTSDFIIGGNTATSYNWLGMIDEVGVWTRALSASEITSLYNSGSGLQYPFGAGSSSIKTVNGLAKASVKTVNGLAIASVKSINGLT